MGYGVALLPAIVFIVVAWVVSIWLLRQGFLFIAVLAAIAPPTLLFAFLSFDELVKYEYANHRDAWVEDGKPSGFYWRAWECNCWSSGFAMQRLAFIWLFRSAYWTQSSPVHIWLTRFRIAVLAWNGAFVVGIAYVLLVIHGNLR